MGHHGEHKEYPAQAAIFLIASVVGLLVLIYGYGSAIEDTAGSIFDLTPADLYTIPFGALAFFLFWQLMQRMVFKPLVALVEAREAATEGAEEHSGSARQEAGELIEEYESKLTEARVEGMQLKAKQLSQAQEQSRKILAEASDRANEELASARAAIISEGESLRAQLVEQSDELVNEVVTKVQEPSKNAGAVQ